MTSLTVWLQVAEPHASTGGTAHLGQGSAPSHLPATARRTLKKSPYLRFGSPAPPSRRSQPRVVERVAGPLGSQVRGHSGVKGVLTLPSVPTRQV